MAAKSKSVEVEQCSWQTLKFTGITVTIRGVTPLIMNSMSFKSQCGLLVPQKKNKAERELTMKHVPRDEFRNSCYTTDDGPTRLYIPTSAIKAAIQNAALETPGATKAQLGRLVWIPGDQVPVYGVPRLFMAVVRSADMNRTPDIRTRAIIPKWCATFKVQFACPPIPVQSMLALIGTAGLIIGIGDFRQEKGKGNNGQFEPCDASDVNDIMKLSRKAQDEALESATCYDHETERLLAWWDEMNQRRQSPDSEASNSNGKKHKNRVADIIV